MNTRDRDRDRDSPFGNNEKRAEERRDAEDYRSMLEWRKKQEMAKEKKKLDDALDIGSETMYPSLNSSGVKPLQSSPSPSPSPSLKFKSALLKKSSALIQKPTQIPKTYIKPYVPDHQPVLDDRELDEELEFNSNLGEKYHRNQW